MAQQLTDDFNINPLTQDGDGLSEVLNRLNSAMETTQSGDSRPPNAKRGMLWLDTTDPDTHYLKVCDTTVPDTVIANIDVSTWTASLPNNIVTPASLDYYHAGSSILHNGSFSFNTYATHTDIAGPYVGQTDFTNRWFSPNTNQMSDTSYDGSGFYYQADLLSVGASETVLSMVQGVRDLTENRTTVNSKTYTVSFDIKVDEDSSPFVTARWSQLRDFVGATVVASNEFNEQLAVDGYIRKEFTFTVGSIGSANDVFFLEIGANNATGFTTIATGVRIKNVQLELGKYASDFEVKSNDRIKHECEYYLRFIDDLTGSGYANAANEYMAWANVPVDMRNGYAANARVSSASPDMFGVNVEDSISNQMYHEDTMLSVSFKAIAAGAVQWQLAGAYIELYAEYL